MSPIKKDDICQDPMLALNIFPLHHNTDKHGLKDLCKELIGVDISKHQQTSDWAADELTVEQIDYAASDVLYLHRLKEKMDYLLMREKRNIIAEACFNFLPDRAYLDVLGWQEEDIFAH